MKELSVLEGVVEFVPAGAAPLGLAEATRGAWEGKPATVEVVAPDRFCAHVFLELIDSLFPCELVGSGPSWVIRLQPPRGSAWEGRLLLLVQRWLETCPLPCATLRYRGRKYVFRSASTHTCLASGSEQPRDRVALRAAHGSETESRSPARAATHGGFQQAQIALVTTP
jgi:hypothetical protein